MEPASLIRRLVFACAVTGGMAFGTVASASDDGCAPTKIAEWPVCSPQQMERTVNEQRVTQGGLFRDYYQKFGRYNPQPGPAQLSISGVVSGAGDACAAHITVNTGNPAAGLMQQIPENLQGQIPDAVRERMMQGMGRDETPDSHVVFQVYSPNVFASQMGLLLGDLTTRHGGVGGWRPNTAANVVIALPGTAPEDLVAGKTYKARAVAKENPGDTEGGVTWGRLFTGWSGSFHPVAPPRDPKRARRAVENCRAHQRGLEQVMAQVPSLRDTLGRTADRLCDSPWGLAFQGSARQVIAAQLTGEVTIDRITHSQVIGRFQLSGNAQVAATTSELTYDNDGRLTGNRNDTEKTAGSIAIEGRFHAPNTRNDTYLPPTMRKAVTVSGEQGEPEQPMQVESHVPARRKRNVDWENPTIRVKFDKRYAPETIEPENLSIAYRDASGQMQRVPVYFELDDPRRVTVVPKQELKDGVRYRVTLVGGEAGIRSESDLPLAADYTWDFYTTVDLDDRESIEYDLPGTMEPREGIEPHIFQTSRDARLIAGKRAAARVYVKWAKRDDVHPDFQVEDFNAHVRVKAKSGRQLFDEKRGQLIRRTDVYSEAEIRGANHSVQLYGWSPAEDGVLGVVAEVEPTDQCIADPRVFESEFHSVDFAHLQRDLDFIYYFVRVGAWREGIPPAAKREGHAIARNAEVFTTQNFPVLETNAHYGGVVYMLREWLEAKQRSAREVMLEIHDALAADSNADVVVAFVPNELYAGGGTFFDYAWTAGEAGGTVDFAFPTVQMSIKAAGAAGHKVSQYPALIHEFGHVYGLEHRPRAVTSADREFVCTTMGRERFPGIEGLRIAPSGYDSANKSFMEGNADSGEALLPVMYPCVDVRGRHFIVDDHYETLISTMSTIASRGLASLREQTEPLRMADLRSDPFNVAAAQTSDAPATDVDMRYWMVAGRIRDDGTPVIEGLTALARRPDRVPEAGAWTLSALDEEGGIVSQREVALPQAGPFRAVIATRGLIGGVRLTNGDGTRASLTPSAHAPTVAMESVDPIDGGEAVRVSWRSNDADGDRLRHRLHYSPDGEAPWSLLAAGHPGETLAVERARLAPGPEPTIQVTAADAFHASRAKAPVPVTAGLRVTHYGPSGDGVTVRAGDIYVTLNAPLRAEAVGPDVFMLEDLLGERVPATIEHDAATETLRLKPEQALTPGMRYTATVAGVTDRYGNPLDGSVSWTFTPRIEASGDADGDSTSDADQQ